MNGKAVFKKDHIMPATENSMIKHDDILLEIHDAYEKYDQLYEKVGKIKPAPINIEGQMILTDIQALLSDPSHRGIAQTKLVHALSEIAQEILNK